METASQLGIRKGSTCITSSSEDQEAEQNATTLVRVKVIEFEQIWLFQIFPLDTSGMKIGRSAAVIPRLYYCYEYVCFQIMRA